MEILLSIYFSHFAQLQSLKPLQYLQPLFNFEQLCSLLNHLDDREQS